MAIGGAHWRNQCPLAIRSPPWCAGLRRTDVPLAQKAGGTLPAMFAARWHRLANQYNTFFLFKCLHSELLKSVNYFDLLNRVSLFSDQP